MCFPQDRRLTPCRACAEAGPLIHDPLPCRPRLDSAPMRYAMIMAGGAGTRLWPMSRKDRPKQLLRFITRPGDTQARSLLELANRRLKGLIDQERRYICTAEGYRAAIRDQLPDFADAQIL